MGRRVIILLFNADSQLLLLSRAIGLLLLAALPLAIAFEIYPQLLDLHETLHFDTLSKAAAWTFAAFSVVLLAFWCLAFGLLVLAYVLTAILSTTEFIVRRVAEYPKGPVFALSALLGGIGVIFKSFGF